jgi:hypothetical protein
MTTGTITITVKIPASTVRVSLKKQLFPIAFTLQIDVFQYHDEIS